MSDAHGGGGGSGDEILWVIIALVVFFVVIFGFSKPFDPTYLNIYALFGKLLPGVQKFVAFLINPHFWTTLGYISMTCSLLCITIIIFSLVRMFEIQYHEDDEIEHEINEALARDAEQERNENPRWRYIETLVDSPNESDWRIAIIEADTMLDEILDDRGYSGDTLADKLKAVDGGAFTSLQNAWDAHNVRNQIAHAGSDFSITELEARRVIKMFKNVFEELRAI
ncbi:MAG: hypothetical protein NTX85_01315 [Candidatus Nomurabacteria bacterium]|nr:hypothetical protein [Candidatus Nomurabacteria bacterium]